MSKADKKKPGEKESGKRPLLDDQDPITDFFIDDEFTFDGFETATADSNTTFNHVRRLPRIPGKYQTVETAARAEDDSSKATRKKLPKTPTTKLNTTSKTPAAAAAEAEPQPTKSPVQRDFIKDNEKNNHPYCAGIAIALSKFLSNLTGREEEFAMHIHGKGGHVSYKGATTVYPVLSIIVKKWSDPHTSQVSLKFEYDNTGKKPKLEKKIDVECDRGRNLNEQDFSNLLKDLELGQGPEMSLEFLETKKDPHIAQEICASVAKILSTLDLKQEDLKDHISVFVGRQNRSEEFLQLAGEEKSKYEQKTQHPSHEFLSKLVQPSQARVGANGRDGIAHWVDKLQSEAAKEETVKKLASSSKTAKVSERH